MHWSRWGDPAEAGPLAESAFALVDTFIGTRETPAVAPADVRLTEPLAADLVAELAEIVGAAHVLTDHETRLHRTRGKSTPDMLKIRSGDGSDSPDAVVRPANHDEVVALIDWAVRRHVALVPFGGGTSVVGGLAARRDGFAGVVSLDLLRFDKLVEVDRDSMTVVLEPGLRGPAAEALLAAEGLTLGHFPQSFQYASIGGFAVTRSSGQSSAGYGRFDSLVVGLKVATPQGTLELGNSPANAAGPDLRELVMGSEGAFGVVTAVRVRVRPLPEVRTYEGWRWPSFAEGAAAMRTLAQAGMLPTVLRLSDENETAINLAKPSEVGGESAGGCLMITGYEGTPAAVEAKKAAVTALLAGLGGENQGPDSGQAWADGRFHGPYLRDSLLDVGVLVETMETVTFWSNLDHVYTAVKDALVASLGAETLVLCHISHVYETGASLYFTVATKASEEPLPQWLAAKAAASDAMVHNGASITHHHAVGQDHKPWLAEEIGPVGVEMLRAVKERIDPTGVLNPGVLIP
ncbi:FAD-binding oxidoreductase [Nocardioides marmoriginsengisoli]|uniref:FAD-binding oxidoreductase n=2 Tax=Nocardioides marmoriginsengisoli TaxID=661483 RepID=A0A3N0CC81_9ACTN|nr:FAD-binding oxidoreductase [Nocardioides marmoriginsengisoli]